MWFKKGHAFLLLCIFFCDIIGPLHAEPPVDDPPFVFAPPPPLLPTENKNVITNYATFSDKLYNNNKEMTEASQIEDPPINQHESQIITRRNLLVSSSGKCFIVH